MDKFNKQQYWKNRLEQKRGQGTTIIPIRLLKESDTSIQFDNGEPIIMSRKYRRMNKDKLTKETNRSIHGL